MTPIAKKKLKRDIVKENGQHCGFATCMSVLLTLLMTDPPLVHLKLWSWVRSVILFFNHLSSVVFSLVLRSHVCHYGYKGARIQGCKSTHTQVYGSKGGRVEVEGWKSARVRVQL